MGYSPWGRKETPLRDSMHARMCVYIYVCVCVYIYIYVLIKAQS